MKNHPSVYIAAFICTLIVFVVNGLIPSFVNGYTEGLNFDLYRLWENAKAEELYYFRMADSEFARKLFVLGFQRICYSVGIPFQFAFNLINSIALFSFFITSFRLAKNGLDFLSPFIFSFFIVFTFPILFAFLPVLFTYDDIVQFLFLSLFFIAFYDRKNLQAYFWFFLACLAKETTIFFGAFLLPYFWIEKKDLKQMFIELIPYGCIVFLYSIIIYYSFDDSLKQGSIDYMKEMRFTFYKANFSDPLRVVEVSYYILSVYLLPLVLWFNLPKVELKKSIRLGFIVLTVSNLLIALVAAEAVEARIYFMTLIPLFPFFAPKLQETWLFLKNKQNFRPKLLVISVLVSSFLISLYSPQVKRAYYVFAPYFFVYFSFCIYLILLHTKGISSSINSLSKKQIE